MPGCVPLLMLVATLALPGAWAWDATYPHMPLNVHTDPNEVLPTLRSKFQPQVSNWGTTYFANQSATWGPMDADIEDYSWHGFIMFAYYNNLTQEWEDNSTNWNTFCSCVFLEPQWCLTTYECVKPLILYESTHWLRYRVEWKASSFSASAWNSGVGYVDSFEYDASLGLGLLYLDRSPFSRQSITGKGTLAFAKLATYDANRTNSTLTFLGMGQSPSSGSPAGMLKKKPVYLRSKDYARTSLAGLNYTWGHVNYSQPLTALWNPDYPLYPHVLYTEPVHCVLDWGGPLVTPDGEVMGLLVGYPGPTTSDGGPYVYRFQQKAYKYPQGCTDAADVFVDLTAPAVQQWLQDRISARPYLKVTGPGTERGDGVYNREIPRGGFGPYTFAFKVDVSVGFDEIRVAMNPSIEFLPPRTPEIYFNFIHGTSTPPSSVQYRAETDSIHVAWDTGVHASAEGGFHVYPSIPAAYHWGSVLDGANASHFGQGVITISLNLRAANNCTPQTFEVRGQYGRCLSVDYTNANAARQQDVILETCNGNAMQKWQYNGNGLLGHKGTGKCLSLENLGETGTQARVVSCDNLAPQLLAPTAVIGEAGNYTIQTAGADFGVPYCLLAMGTWQPEVYKGLCNSTWSTFSGDFEPYYYRCQNDGYHFLRTRATLESACSCSGIKELAAGLESHCG